MVVHRSRNSIKIGFLVMVFMAIVPTFSVLSAVLIQDELAWDDIKYQAKYSEAPVRDVLDDMLRFNETKSIISPGIKGFLTYDFYRNPMSIQAAFEKVITEFNLTYTFDAVSQIVTILPNELMWDDIEHRSLYVEAPVRDVLDDILRLNGTKSIISSDIEGFLVYDFRGNPMSIQAAFEKVITQFNLTYTFDAVSQIVTILPNNLMWKNIKYTKFLENVPVRDVLTDILKRNEKKAIFSQDVNGKVTFDFRKNPLTIQRAFDKICTEFNLTYTFDGAGIVTIQQPLFKFVNETYSPKYADLQTLTDSYQRSGIVKKVQITVVPRSNIIIFRGPKKEVDSLQQISVSVDESLRNMRNRKLQDRELDMETQKKSVPYIRMISSP